MSGEKTRSAVMNGVQRYRFTSVSATASDKSYNLFMISFYLASNLIKR